MNGQIFGWLDRQMVIQRVRYEWLDRQMVRQIDGQMDICYSIIWTVSWID